MLFKFTFLIAALLVVSDSYGQFIRLTLNIPSGYEVNVNPIEPLVLEPPKNSNSTQSLYGATKIQVRWIEMRSRENVSFILSFKPDTKGMRSRSLSEVYFLNDGSTNFGQADRIINRNTIQTFFSKPLLMHNMPKDTSYFVAWLGVPASQSGVITIEYP